MNDRKQSLLGALRTFARQRPGLEFGNYGCIVAYRSEMRSITKDLAQAQSMLSAVELRDSISADAIIEASKHAYSGRLTITESEPGKFSIDYCTGQYWPAEYRRAVCAVLSSALWSYWRDNCMPEHDGELISRDDSGAERYRIPTYRGLTSPDFLRKIASDELGRGIAARWFN